MESSPTVKIADGTKYVPVPPLYWFLPRTSRLVVVNNEPSTTKSQPTDANTGRGFDFRTTDVFKVKKDVDKRWRFVSSSSGSAHSIVSTRLWPYILGYVPYVVMWIIVVSTFYEHFDEFRENIPDWVNQVVVGSITVFSSFGLTQLLQQWPLFPPAAALLEVYVFFRYRLFAAAGDDAKYEQRKVIDDLGTRGTGVARSSTRS